MTAPKAIIRPDEDGHPDDIAISDVTMFRLERMDRNRWWCAVYRGKQRVAFSIAAWPSGWIDVRVTEDELGCVDDTEDAAQVAALLGAVNG